MTIKPEEKVYEPPPDRACQLSDTPYDLCVDEETGEHHVLSSTASFYRGKVVKFCLEQRVRVANESFKVRRIDTEHGTVHVHRFTRRDQAGIREVLFEIPVHGHDVVDQAYYEHLDKLLDEWDEHLRSWRKC